MKCLCELKGLTGVCMRACARMRARVSAVLISFIYSWTGRSADASGRERRHGSRRQKV